MPGGGASVDVVVIWSLAKERVFEMGVESSGTLNSEKELDTSHQKLISHLSFQSISVVKKNILSWRALFLEPG